MDTRRAEPTPFARLALAHVASVVGDTWVTVSLADSIFFSVSPGEARPKVLLYLLLTMLPFAIVSPLIGPALDRTLGGRRLLMAIGLFGRFILAILIARDYSSLFLYPEAFGVLVLSKGQTVAKGALVPAVVKDHQMLVRANARLSMLTAIAGLGFGGLGVLILQLGVGYLLSAAAAAYLLGSYLALKIPRAEKIMADTSPLERAELRSRSVVLAGSAMAANRAAIGFVTFFVAFALRAQNRSAIYFGLTLAVSGLGGFVGVGLAPVLRKVFREPLLLAGALLVPGIVVLLAARLSGITGLVATAAVLSAGSTAARQAFDSLLQRDAPDALRGRAFARFEARFQVAWVLGALVPVVADRLLGTRLGLFALALFLIFAGLFYLGGIITREGDVRR